MSPLVASPSASSAKPTPSVPFWTEDPNVLLNPSYITEWFPASTMAYEQKLNAITRLLLLATAVLYVWLGRVRTLVFGALSVGIVYLVHYYHVQERKASKEGLASIETDLSDDGSKTNPALLVLNSDDHGRLPAQVFDLPAETNPFSNVLLTDINGRPNKRPAPPAYNPLTNQQILESAKKAVVTANPGNTDIQDKLFKDLGDQLSFEQSMRQFYSTPSTTTPEDQQAFAEFCYGSMISCAEGNKFACARNAAAMRHTLQ
jgi:hypothetical protein